MDNMLPTRRPDLHFSANALPVFGGFQPSPPPAAPPAVAPVLASAPTSRPSAARATAAGHTSNINDGQSAAQPGATPVHATIPGLRPGVAQLLPRKFVELHVICGGVVPYRTPRSDFRFKRVRAPTNMTVAELLTALGATRGAAGKNGLTECVEVGEGVWAKGVSVFRDKPDANKTLAQLGWDDSRGDTQPPVWLVVHRAS